MMKELARREEVLPEVVRSVEDVLAKAMYPERVLRFPEVSVGELDLYANGRSWNDPRTGFADARGAVTIEAGCRAFLRLQTDQHPAFLTGFEASGLQGLTCVEGNRVIVWPYLRSASLSRLEQLNLRSTNVGDISVMADLHQLQWLILSHTPVSDVNPLASLHQLRQLRLDNTQVGDVNPLASLHQLEALWLSYTRVSDINALANLSQLRWLNLSDTRVRNVKALESLSQLEMLELRNIQVRNLSPLANLCKLEVLHLNNTQVSDVRPLASLNQLTRCASFDFRNPQRFRGVVEGG